jgi:hypothetical protein
MYVPASKPFDQAWFEVPEDITVYCTWYDNRQFQDKLVVQNSRQIYRKGEADPDKERAD